MAYPQIPVGPQTVTWKEALPIAAWAIDDDVGHLASALDWGFFEAVGGVAGAGA